jgi:hypothetical protein
MAWSSMPRDFLLAHDHQASAMVAQVVDLSIRMALSAPRHD